MAHCKRTLLKPQSFRYVSWENSSRRSFIKFFVINCWTQDKFGYDGQAYADAKGIGQCLKSVAALALDLKIYDLYAPPIGCGLGGLDWDKGVFPLFSEIESKYPLLKITICDIKLK